MASSHHEPKKKLDLMDRFIDESMGVADRQFPDGRTGPNDDGLLTYMMANDDKHRVIRIKFPKPIESIAMTVTEAEELRDQLTERIMAMKGIGTPQKGAADAKED